MRLALIRGHLQVHHEVGGVSGGGQNPRARQRLVRRAVVHPRRRRHAVFARLEPHQREIRVELLRPRLGEQVGIVIPSRALQEKPGDVAAVLRRFSCVFVGFSVLDDKVPLDGVDGESVFASVVLKRPRQESLREEQSADPVDRGRAVIDPPVDELDALQQVQHPRRQGLQRRVRLAGPRVGNLVVED